MTTTTKTNYNVQATNRIKEAMRNNQNHEDQVASIIDLSVELNKTVRSITAKMSSLSRTNEDLTFYKKERVTKTGLRVESKADKVERIAVALGVSSEKLDSLEKTTKSVLDTLIAGLSSTSENA